MHLKTNHKLYPFFVGFIGILIVYSLYYLLVRDTHAFYQIPRKMRHVFKLLSVLYVYGIGMWAFSRYGNANWIVAVWHLVHVILIGFLCAIGLIDWFYKPVSFAWKHLGGSAHEFLISPVLYIIAGIVQKNLYNQTHGTPNS